MHKYGLIFILSLALVACGGGGSSKKGSSSKPETPICPELPIYPNPNSSGASLIELCSPNEILDHYESVALVSTVMFQDGERGSANQLGVWSSSDENIATVDANGVVTAEFPGTVTITHIVGDVYEDLSIDIMPIVTDMHLLTNKFYHFVDLQPIILAEYSNIPTNKPSYDGDEEYITLRDIVRSTDDYFDIDSLFSGVGVGIEEYLLACHWEVFAPGQFPSLNASDFYFCSYLDLIVKVDDGLIEEDDYLINVDMSSSNEEILSSDEGGEIFLHGAGEVDLTITVGDVSVITTVDVIGVESISLDTTDSTITVGQSVQFSASATYSDNTQMLVTEIGEWSSSDYNIARVDSQGILSSFNTGEVTITYKLGDITQSVQLEINLPPAVVSLKGSDRAFAALREDGSVVTWGDSLYGGDSSSVASQIDGTIKVVSIDSSERSFAALREDGSVVTWGDSSYGGDSTSVASQIDGSVDVVSIVSTTQAFTALRVDGSIVTWGDTRYSTNSVSVPPMLTNAVSIYSTWYGFSAIKKDGSVATWGDNAHGGNSSSVDAKLDGEKDVVSIYSNIAAFAALREDGSVVTWGSYNHGGDSSSVESKLDGVVSLTSTNAAFAALRADGSVVTWGYDEYGGDSSLVAPSLDGSMKVISIYSSSYAFSALREDGSVITWGHEYSGGDSSSVTSKLNGLVDVVFLVSTNTAFAALRVDGSVVTWGHSSYGGSSSRVEYLIGNMLGMESYSSDRDSDRDGIDNLTEMQRCEEALPCLQVGNADSDGDGVWDGFELDNGSDPLKKNTDVIVNGQVTVEDSLDDRNGDGYPDYFIFPVRGLNTPQ